MTATGPRRDIVVAGGGIIGLALAAVLKTSLGRDLAICVCDPGFGRRRSPGRASAITAGPRRMLGAIGVWDKIEAEAQAISEMIVTDSRTLDPVRPIFLNFAGELEPGEPFAHMVPNDVLADALEASCRGQGVECVAAAVSDFAATESAVTLRLGEHGVYAAAVVVAADGRDSPLRESAGIASVGFDYDQAGIVATIGHERDHGGRAEEHFLPPGPFAILPLRHRRSSIVWTERRSEADWLVGLDSAAFLRELEQRFQHRLGAIEVLDQPRAFPLSLRIARRFVAARLALVGDSAHTIHPIAGQGLNLGLRDVAALAQCLAERLRLGLDPGAASALRRYEQARRFDTLAMAATTDLLNRFFSNDTMAWRLLRDLGLGLVDRLPSLKAGLIREAAGLGSVDAKLLRGELV
jgi:2-octaprenyl-6-methoxyphenol hydroxylase